MASRIISQLRASQLLASKLSARGFHFASANQVPMELKMPALSPTMTEGTIIKWHKKEGDTIVPGDMLMEIQTDKAVVPYELEEEGVLAKQLVDESAVVQTGDLIGMLAYPGEDWKSVAAPEQSQSSSPAPEAVAEAVKSPEIQTTVTHSAPHDGILRIGPAARILITEYGVNPSSVPSVRGFVSKSDVKEYIIKNNISPAPVKAEASAPAAAPISKSAVSSNVNPEYEPDFEDIELSNMRKVIAKRLVLSKTTIPHSYISSTCVMDKIISIRKEMIANKQKVSLNDFIIKAASLALKLVPEVNSNQVANTTEFKPCQTVDISIAVATDKGLITPIVANADQLCVTSISETVKILAEKARNNKLQPHEFQGGSFSISNLGMFGISEFSAVINPPQTAILAVGGSKATFNTDIIKQTEMSFTLSYDARCVNLDRAFKFMNTFKYFLANPDLLVEQIQTF